MTHHGSAAPHHSLKNCFLVWNLFELGVIVCSFYLFLNRILFHHDVCDIHGHFMAILIILNNTFRLFVTR